MEPRQLQGKDPDYDYIRMIGKGGFGTVCLVGRRKDGKASFTSAPYLSYPILLKANLIVLGHGLQDDFPPNMSFHFRHLCELFDIIDGLHAKSTDKLSVAIHAWFDEHGPDIPRHGPGAVAFLSCFLPERRPDRVYGLRRSDLECIIRSAHGLGQTRMGELQCWRNPDGPDFASAVQRVLSAVESTSRSQETVTVGEMEQVLNRLASRSPFSSPSLKEEVRRASSKPVDRFKELAAIFRRLHSSSTKWMIRIIFKDLSSLELPELPILQRFHFLLPDLLRFQNSFHSCIALLEIDTLKEMPINPAEHERKLLRESASHYLKPHAGVMVIPPSRDKARSIAHGCHLARGRMMSVEDKYDGEYCQIYVCLTGSSHHVQIFSKSGRDSTIDRAGVHDAIMTGLAIGTPLCRFQRTCIMEGELLVWDDNSKQIESFRKIRKHVQRAGHRLGCGQDSPVRESEHLMVMLYDLLLLDDSVSVRDPHDRRRRQLRSIVRPTQGRLDIGTRTKIDFGSRGPADRLRERFADTIARGGEGLVLKGCADPYLSLHDCVHQIKLKKDYIAGLGDTLDFAIVGGRRDAGDEAKLRLGKLSWTSFYVACLKNKGQVQRFNTKPIFQVVARIDRHGMSKSLIGYLNQHGSFRRVPFAHVRNEMEVFIDQEQLRRLSELFREPFAVELMGAGFDRPADVNYLTLRFPRLQKIHHDRTWKDVVSFAELQEVARQCQHPPAENADQRKKLWLARLQGSDQQAQSADSITSQETFESPKSSDTQASLDQDQPAQSRARAVSLEIADSQSDSIASSSVVPVAKRALDESLSEISPPRKRLKQMRSTIGKSADEMQMSRISWTRGLKTAAELGQGNTNSSRERTMSQALQNSKSTLASQTPQSNLHRQTSRLSPAARAFLSKLKMPLLVCSSSKDNLFNPFQSQLDVSQDLAISFTFSRSFFIDSVLLPETREASGEEERSCWHVIVARLDEYHSFSAEVQTLMTMVGKQLTATNGDFHILFADGRLFQLLAGDDDRRWQDAIMGYLRCEAGKVTQITYGVRFAAKFLQGIR